MTPDEAAILCAVVADICPAQRFTAGTPLAWAEVLGDVRFVDAKTAIGRLARKLRFIATADIVDEVKALRRERLAAPGIGDALADIEARLGLAETRQLRGLVADGAVTAEHLKATVDELALGDGTRAMPALEGVLRRAPRA